MLADELDETVVLATRQSFALTFCSKFKTKAQLWLTAVPAETVEVSKPHCA